MSDSLDRFQQRFEIFANAQQADIEAARAVLQGIVLLMLVGHPKAKDQFLELRNGVLSRLDNETRLAVHDQDAMRKAELVLERASRIFDELSPAFGLQNVGGSSGQSH